MRIERLGDLGDGPSVLRALATATRRLGLPPPAALIGEWFGSRAVIAPSLSAIAVTPADVFAAPPGGRDDGPVGGGWFGHRAAGYLVGTIPMVIVCTVGAVRALTRSVSNTDSN